jgi:hypothetical protein
MHFWLYGVVALLVVLRRNATAQKLAQLLNAALLPPLGEAIDDLDMFVAGESEADEPLAVKHSRRLLQQPNPPPVIID